MKIWVRIFFLKKIFIQLLKEYEGGLDVQTWREVPHENGDLYGGMLFLLRVGAPLVGLCVGLVRWMK